MTYAPLAFGAETVIRARPAPGVVVRMLVDDLPEPALVVLLLPGGDGRINIRNNGTLNRLDSDFLVRSRQHFIRHNIATAVIDAPVVQRKRIELGITHRRSKAHAQEIGAAIEMLRARFRKPVWVVGTSRGTISAANVATSLARNGPDGIVLTSSFAMATKQAERLVAPPAVSGIQATFDFSKINLPALVVHHREDGCGTAPLAGAQLIHNAMINAIRKKIFVVSGGPADAGACQGRSHHGFLGIEKQTIDAIAGWMLEKDTR
ncbi:MAG: hypothetical protein O3A84_03940 [Proteobacteria bacterium]|nr:hypothetical protein [Pseudomonadota bacterium]